MIGLTDVGISMIRSVTNEVAVCNVIIWHKAVYCTSITLQHKVMVIAC